MWIRNPDVGICGASELRGLWEDADFRLWGRERGLRLASLHLLVIAFYKILHLQDEVID